MKDARPNSLRRPADEPVVEGLPRTIRGWCIDPPTARLQHMDDSANHAAIIDPRLAPRVGRQVRLNACELLHRSQKRSRLIDRLHPEALNHKPDPSGMPFMGPEPSSQPDL